MILISPYSKPMRNGERNPKNYPYWDELILLINTWAYQNIKSSLPLITQLRYEGEPHLDGTAFLMNMSLSNFFDVINKHQIKTFISVDNFFQHMCHYYKKQCIVLWGQSDPSLFGYKENINLLKDRKYLRPNQFDTWENCKFNADAFLSAEEVFKQIKHLL